LGQPDEALKSLRQALRRSRRPGVVHKRLGDLLMNLGRHQEAIEEYRATVLRRPELAKKQPELISLIEKAQRPGENLEPLAEQIRDKMASISAARRAERKDGASKVDRNGDASAGHRESGAKRFGGLRRRRARSR
jgi:tetratricopeptide (TPR) repeat protein